MIRIELLEKFDGDGPCCLEVYRTVLILKGDGVDDWEGRLQIRKVAGGWGVRRHYGAAGYREAKYSTLRLHVDGEAD